MQDIVAQIVHEDCHGEDRQSDLDGISHESPACHTHTKSGDCIDQGVESKFGGGKGVLAKTDGEAEDRRLQVATGEGDKDDEQQHQIGDDTCDLNVGDPGRLQHEGHAQ